MLVESVSLKVTASMFKVSRLLSIIVSPLSAIAVCKYMQESNEAVSYRHLLTIILEIIKLFIAQKFDTEIAPGQNQMSTTCFDLIEKTKTSFCSVSS